MTSQKTSVDFPHQTTIVTGASSGIGMAFARELARRGSDVVLVARRLDRLQSLASELRSEHGVRVTPVALDLSEPRAGRRLAADLETLGVTATSLVNNAGFATQGAFHEEDPERLVDEINVDVANLVDLTRAFIGQLRGADGGFLVNVASMAGYSPSPGMAVYAACKAFVLSFTEALWYESRDTGLRVLTLSPGLTRTEFFDELASGDFTGNYQTPEQVVETAMRALQGRDRPSVASGTLNRIASTLPRLFTRKRALLLSAAISARSRARAVSAAGAGSAH